MATCRDTIKIELNNVVKYRLHAIYHSMKFIVEHRADINHIPDGITHLTFSDDFDQPLEVGHIPDGVTHLTFSDDFDQPLEVGHIPDSVTHLIFGGDFNQPLEAGHIPDSVTYLTFGQCFNRPLGVGHIPDGVTHLTFGACFNQPLEADYIPDSIKHLTFGYRFNRPLVSVSGSSNLETITCMNRDTTIDLSNIPLFIKIYLCPRPKDTFISLSDIQHQVYVKSSHLDAKIIYGLFEGVHYTDTIEENGMKYLLVRGDNYVPVTRAKSARK